MVAVEGEPDVSPLSDTQKVEADNPAWIPGGLESPRHVRREVREHLEHGHPRLRGNVYPEGGLPVRSAAALVARAFAAYSDGDWDACDRLIARGHGSWGEAFAKFVAYAVSPAFSYRPAGPGWDAFRARLAVTVLSPGLQEMASTWPSPAIRAALRPPGTLSLSMILRPGARPGSGGWVCYPRSSAALSMAASSSAVFTSTLAPNNAL
jgi:hypothetical protein